LGIVKTMAFGLAAAFWMLPAGSTPAQAQATPPQPAATAASGTNSGPRIQFAEVSHDFGIVAAGEFVPYAFVFTNTGDLTLEVTNVHPACGCTTAGEWTKRVEPGQTGTIPIQFNSTEFNGPVEKTVEVRSTAKSHPLVTLSMKGTVWRSIEVTPQFVFLTYSTESPTNPWTTVSIVNNLDTPLTVYPPEWNSRVMDVELKTNEPGHSFQLIVAVRPPLQRNANTQITLKTSSTNMPEIRLTAMVHIQPIVSINPAKLVLPAPPLASRITNSVRIQNIGTNNVTVSEATVNYKDVEVRVKEEIPGKSFLASLVFPEGFGLTPGQPMHLTVKTSHPKYPQLEIPVLQMARTATPAPGPASPKPLTPSSEAGGTGSGQSATITPSPPQASK
jgi:hypothetical protein